MKKFLMPFLIFATTASAQVVSDIRFEGLIHLSVATAREILGFGEGEQIDINKIDQSIKRLFAQGYFEDIWVSEEKGVLTYHFVEKPMISKVDIDGYFEGKKDELPSITGIKKGDIFEDKKIAQAKERIKSRIQQEGFFDTVVETKIQKTESGSVEVLFMVNKGENIITRKLVFCGIKAFEKGEIEDVIANRERDFMGWLWGRNDGKVKMEELEFDSARIKDLYMQKGYLDAKVSNPFMRVDFATYDAKLVYNIEEGAPYTVEDIQIVLAEPVTEVKMLLSKLKLKKNKVFNIERMRQDLQILKEEIANLGYAYVQVVPDFKKDEKSKKVTVVYSIEPGKKVHINDVIIAGNQKTIDRVIRRDVFLTPGDLYNLTDLKDSKNALKRTGYFEDVQIDEKRVGDDKMDLVVRVKEMPTGNIMVGGGYGSYDGVILNGSISDKNVLGSGIDMGLGIDYSSKSMRFNVSLFNPRIFDSEYSFGINLYNSSYEAYDYTEDKKGGSVSVGKQYTRHLKGSMAYEYVISELSDYNTSSYDPIYFPPGQFTKSAITPSVMFDNTDDYYVPRSGFTAGVSTEFAGIGGDEKYVKIYGTFSYFKGLQELIDYDLILRYKAKAGYAYDNGYLPVNEKFYLGGIRSVRGYKSRSISPTILDANGNRILVGGKYMFSNSIEASIPLVEAAKMRAAFFVDYGMIGEDSITEIQRAGTGAAIEWISPMGPIQLVFAQPLNEEPGDRTATFEFTLGQRF